MNWRRKKAKTQSVEKKAKIWSFDEISMEIEMASERGVNVVTRDGILENDICLKLTKKKCKVFISHGSKPWFTIIKAS